MEVDEHPVNFPSQPPGSSRCDAVVQSSYLVTLNAPKMRSSITTVPSTGDLSSWSSNPCKGAIDGGPSRPLRGRSSMYGDQSRPHSSARSEQIRLRQSQRGAREAPSKAEGSLSSRAVPEADRTGTVSGRRVAACAPEVIGVDDGRGRGNSGTVVMIERKGSSASGASDCLEDDPRG
jgi:hypothetical protein